MNTEHNTPPTDEVRIELARMLAENAKPWSFGPDIVDTVMSRFDVRLRGVSPPADDVRELVDRMRKASRAVYLATEATVADDISDMLRRAANAIEVRPYGTVTDTERYATALRAIADGDGPRFVREFARNALEQEIRQYGAVTDAEANAAEQERELHRYSLVPDSDPIEAACTCGWVGAYAIQWRLHRERAALEAAREARS